MGREKEKYKLVPILQGAFIDISVSSVLSLSLLYIYNASVCMQLLVNK